MEYIRGDYGDAAEEKEIADNEPEVEPPRGGGFLRVDRYTPYSSFTASTRPENHSTGCASAATRTRPCKPCWKGAARA